MDFDPLSFFEPDETLKQEQGLTSIILENSLISTPKKIDNTQQNIKQGEIEDDEKANDDDDENNEIVYLQTLDLPQMNPSLPFDIMRTILRLFQPDQVKNFGNTDPSILSSTSDQQVQAQQLEKKSILPLELENLSRFLNKDTQSTLTLAKLPKSSSSNIISYLTKVISYNFPHYSEDERDEIYELASYVMTANSAPALKGNTTRLVEIDGLSKEILLYEPALTQDKVGNITWGASLELSKQIVNGSCYSWLRKLPDSSPILELGAGTGLVTIVLGMLQYKVVSTDLPEIVDNLVKNVELNKLDCIKSTCEENIENNSLIHLTSLDWRSPDEFLQRTSSPSGYETVILSDPVYSPSHPYWVRDAVSAVLSKSENARLVFMVGRRDRFQDVRDCLWKLMFDLGLQLVFSDIVDGLDDYGILQYDYKVFGWKK